MASLLARLLRQWWRNARRIRTRITGWLNGLWTWMEPAWPAAAILVLLLLGLIILWGAYPYFGDIIKGIYIAAWGTFLDVLIAGVILVLFAVGRDRRERIDRYLEEIEDFKKWDNEEARLRLAGNIRRLARLGKTDIDFSGIVLRNISFTSHDIESLKGATFSLGLRLDRLSKNDTVLENVDFSYVDCRGVVFSQSIMGLVGKNLSFTDAKLNDACFEGARLSWTDYKANEADWYEHDEDPDGNPMAHQVHYPAFSGADLKGCSFREAQLEYADFRYANNILEADFSGAEGLETCFFDEDVRERILASAKKKSSTD